LSAVARFSAQHADNPTDPVVMARAMGLLFFAGAAIGFVSLLLPQSPDANLPAVAAVCGVAMGLSAVFWFTAGRLPQWAFTAALFGGTLLINAAIYWSDRPASSYAFYFVWVVMFAAYFMSIAQTVVQAAFVAVSYPVIVRALGGSPESAQRWLLTIWTLVVVGLFITILRSRMDRLIGKLSDAARTDPLTELLNRRGFQEAFDLELERSRRSDRPCTLLLADLDHFKRVNDLLGHPAGDARLKKLAQLLNVGKRRIDSAARMGGEEFALLLPDTDEHGGFVIAERLRHTVRDAFATHPVEVTLSFGVASYPRHGATGDQLLLAADQALYVAKELGRNRSAIYRAEVTAHLMSAKERAQARSEGYLSAVLVLAEAVDLRDAGTAAHSETVGRYAGMLAAELRLPYERVERIRLAGVLHDIGKVGVPDAVLQKAGPLDEREWQEMRKHCELGARLLSGAGLEDIGDWVLSHHERPDGLGYPAGLTADEISLESSILAVADAYEAMVADRVYRPGIGADAARAELERGAGTQFDGEVVEAFLRCIDRGARALAGPPS
jgi:diguanylate cyclase (GGDEF)-like protein/putative nucleotidyltransferase with HDIG domain